MRVLVTDLTYINSERCCLAGWCSDKQAMVRPLPGGHHWPTALISTLAVEPGAVLQCVESHMQHSSTYPHHTEDVRVAEQNSKILEIRKNWWLGKDCGPAAENIQQIFEYNMKSANQFKRVLKSLYVQTHTKTSSLGAVNVPVDKFRFVEDDFGEGKLRASFSDGEAHYDVSVSSLALRQAHLSGGIDEMNASLPAMGLLHVRIGLARAFDDQPDRCNVMINGVFW